MSVNTLVQTNLRATETSEFVAKTWLWNFHKKRMRISIPAIPFSWADLLCSKSYSRSKKASQRRAVICVRSVLCRDIQYHVLVRLCERKQQTFRVCDTCRNTDSSKRRRAPSTGLNVSAAYSESMTFDGFSVFVNSDFIIITSSTFALPCTVVMSWDVLWLQRKLRKREMTGVVRHFTWVDGVRWILTLHANWQVHSVREDDSPPS